MLTSRAPMRDAPPNCLRCSTIPASTPFSAREGVTDVTTSSTFLSARPLPQPKIIMGYSDVTTLHAYFWKQGWVTFHGPMVSTDFSRVLDDMGPALTSAVAWDAGPRFPQVLAAGTAEGTLLGGCLSIAMTSRSERRAKSIGAVRSRIPRRPGRSAVSHRPHVVSFARSRKVRRSKRRRLRRDERLRRAPISCVISRRLTSRWPPASLPDIHQAATHASPSACARDSPKIA